MGVTPIVLGSVCSSAIKKETEISSAIFCTVKDGYYMNEVFFLTDDARISHFSRLMRPELFKFRQMRLDVFGL
jgi:hypothetical protein